MIKQVTIVGMGAVGLALGCTLAETIGWENIRFLAEGERLERYRREGVTCKGMPCPVHVSDGSDGEADLLIFAVKSTSLQEAIQLAAPCVGEDTTILSLLNGVTSEEVLEQAFGGEKVLYSVTQIDAAREGNDLTYYKWNNLFVGLPEEDYFDRDERLDEVCEFFEGTNVPFVREENILHRMWCKFMFNVGVNQVCMAFETDYGGVQRPGELRDTMIAAMNEARKVGACVGVLVTQKDLQSYLDLLDSVEPASIPSMRQDGLAHRKTEVDLFAGTVMEIAHRFYMKTPVNEKLYQKVKEMETNW